MGNQSGRVARSDNGWSRYKEITELLQMLGVPTSAIFQKPDSSNTYQN
ncbi:YdcF family protein [cyanobacterium endosymbiont of Rhopalodia gibberula]|nr:YdcF family protein [cyanobacterium endosymbiont of Rhopalodia gibberula]